MDAVVGRCGRGVWIALAKHEMTCVGVDVSLGRLPLDVGVVHTCGSLWTDGLEVIVDAVARDHVLDA